MATGDATLIWANGEDEYRTEVNFVIRPYSTAAPDDEDLNTIGRALEDWASGKAETPLTFRHIFRETIAEIAVTPVAP